MTDEVRLIDANALHSEVYGDGDLSKKKSRAAVLLMIEKSPTIEVEPDNGWISVKDRLPDDKELYLICIESGRIDIAYYQPIGDTFSNYEPFWQGSCRITSVTHWKYLPEPPKGE